MPFIKSRVLIEEVMPVEMSETDGKTVGQLVDEQLASMLENMPPNSVPQSIEFGFEDAGDWHNFASKHGEMLDATMRHARHMRKGKPARPMMD